MSRLLTVLYVSLFIATAHASNEIKSKTDLYFSEGLYYAYQGEYFDAISRIDAELGQYHNLDEPELNTLHQYINHAEFSIGDFELYYRMHNRAGRAIKSVIEGNVEDRIRNDAAYRLAKIYHQKQQPENALKTIESIKGKIPDKIRYDLELLKAQIYITNGRFNDAIKLLEEIENVSEVAGFAGYNLAIALIGNKDDKKGLRQLDKVGQLISNDNAVLSIKDKANLVLGYKLMQNNMPEQAKTYFERIRLDGPFSNRALLGLGWADVASEQYKRALVPWSMLAKRQLTDPAVLEVLSGLPFAYSKLEIHGKAAVLYGNALAAYSSELEKLDASISSIREGKFLQAVVREEYKKDQNWLINLRDLPDTPETHYLMQSLASNDFQESLKNYFDLVQLGKKIASWDGYLDAYTEIIEKRKNYYTPLFPSIQDKFRSLDARIKLRDAQQEKVLNRLNSMLISPRPDYLATADERIALNNIVLLEKKNSSKPEYKGSEYEARLNRLRGVISWNIDTEYQDRFTQTHENFRQLQDGFNELDTIYHSFVRTRQAATQSYIGYEQSIRQLRIRINEANEKIQLLLPRQGNMLEQMVINDLQKQRKRIEELQIKARFALAESYDRAVKAQQKEELELELEKNKTDQLNPQGQQQSQTSQNTEDASQ